MSEKTLSILMFFAMLFWGLTWINAKVLSHYLDAYNLIFWRFLFSTVTIAPVVLYFRESFRVSFKNLLLSFIGALFLTLYNYLFFEGTKYGDAGFGGILVTTLNPILTFFIVALITLKKLTKRELFA
ncbi:MAG TPA: EamA family transporter, partial [Nitratifractor sp.]|nr:EamA family transporter [Nitratifractor sp.]